MPSLSETVARVRYSIVRVKARMIGTGFLVNSDGVVLTVRHLYAPKGSPEPTEADLAKITIEMRIPGTTGANEDNFFVTKAVVIDEDRDHDIALLPPRTNPFKIIQGPIGATVISEVRPMDGDPVFATGHAFGSRNAITTSGFIASCSRPLFDVGMGGEGKDVYTAELKIFSGASGSPVFNALTGEVLAIAEMGITDSIFIKDKGHTLAYGWDRTDEEHPLHPIMADSGLSQLIPTSYPIALLKKRNLRFNILKRSAAKGEGRR